VTRSAIIGRPISITKAEISADIGMLIIWPISVESGIFILTDGTFILTVLSTCSQLRVLILLSSLVYCISLMNY